MNDIPAIGSPIRTRAILNEYDLHASKRLGQNFLIDLNVLQGIVQGATIGPDDTVIEIGPGIGSLTEQLAKAAKQVVAYEIDKKLIPILSETLRPYKNVEIVNRDILKADFSIFAKNQSLKIVANLPYYITTPILFYLLNSSLNFKSITVMMQKEVAARLQAGVGSKDYGELSLAIQYRVNVEIILPVTRKAFMPSPNVDSAVVQLTPKENFQAFSHEKELFKIIKASFAHRRKSLVNNLLYYFGKNDENRTKIERSISETGFDLNIRGERLTLENYEQLVNNLSENMIFSKE
ncbi:16S rRNA (adenine(1518)-N(6)/adenine(1519)-N(6))-dimethyltransferase RsmA [Oenococcus oeni]|uniref:Ribosomal RNA small subunit methyltransferase A n=1 Tax=Oenococcus oeni TaxID=1247 RepID=A0A6N4A5L9_OENOE|nr:16S rRNA (adenine(1518)-N(6)/adenine(1519)-N(6))-dimethyltransferase RsmA [Oenococcus oeni]OIM20687.1 16S rRNA (adenine(1518)-N(6)/adenine(1519)-N(6))-dimethyltransferase [Oenococcus oeni]OIM22725.1 16S rRNA (adenine(1518)-N(6)/adenine(1519)-N(6))-dimethyltransferase [Oenococcus oeni]SYW08597.1 dimethyladenosine 16S ribosomal RNA transferase [Oenococcus oeni]